MNHIFGRCVLTLLSSVLARIWIFFSKIGIIEFFGTYLEKRGVILNELDFGQRNGCYLFTKIIVLEIKLTLFLI